MTSVNQPSLPRVIDKFNRKIAAEEQAKKSKANAEKAAAEHKRRSEIQGLEALSPDEDATLVFSLEQFYRSALPSRGRNRVDVPELEAGYLPQHSCPRETLPNPVINPVGLASRSELEAEEFNIQSDNDAIRELKDDLKNQHDHIQRLDADLKATKVEVNRLSTERANARREHRQAIRNSQQDEITRLKRKIDALEQLLEEAGAREDNLEGKVKEGRERALSTEKELYDAHRENMQLRHQLGVWKTLSASSSPKESQFRSKDEPAASVPSSRRSPTVTKVWTVSKPRGERPSLLSPRTIFMKSVK